jgi:hypothetical protein
MTKSPEGLQSTCCYCTQQVKRAWVHVKVTKPMKRSTCGSFRYYFAVHLLPSPVPLRPCALRSRYTITSRYQPWSGTRPPLPLPAVPAAPSATATSRHQPLLLMRVAVIAVAGTLLVTASPRHTNVCISLTHLKSKCCRRDGRAQSLGIEETAPQRLLSRPALVRSADCLILMLVIFGHPTI